jgi:UDP-N-acetylglucosamine--N-acetylmuramyl-(pentapeptide) pyrophosphoryl-undecaprenol N-acetylglucosamine transferase
LPYLRKLKKTTIDHNINIHYKQVKMELDDNTSSGPNFFFAGGGTGGHIYPALAVAEQLRMLEPDANISFLCSNRPIDAHILDQTPFYHIGLPASGFSSKPLGLIKFIANYVKSRKIAKTLLSYNPAKSVLISLGGFVSASAVMVAFKLRIPIVMLNVDFVPGKANKLLARYAKEIFVQFPETARHFGMARRKVTVSGCPLRESFDEADGQRAIEELGLSKQKRVLLIVGGSSGAQSLNNAITLLLPGLARFASSWQIVHVTGRSNYQQVKSAYATASIDFKLVDYYHNMADLYAAAELLIGRAGAVAIAEYTAAGMPAICLPYPYHEDKHQYLNAKSLVDAGAAIIVDDIPTDSLQTTKKLTEYLLPLMKDEKARNEMAAAAKDLATPDAAKNIAERIIEWTKPAVKGEG